MRVLLIPTGRAELAGLPSALGRLFPGHTFEALAPDPSKQRAFDGFTSATLPIPKIGVRSNLDKLIEEASAASIRADVDGVLVVDDLELANQHQPQVVVEEVRASVEKHLQTLHGPRRGRTELALQRKVSLHLVAPMLEAWFFADPHALSRTFGPALMQPMVASAPDFENFLVTDAPYLADTGSSCSYWMNMPPQRRDRKESRPIWIQQGAKRDRHPKAYLAWLRRLPGARRCTEYEETTHGVRALEQLDWQAVLSPSNVMPFLRSLVSDVADLLSVPSPSLSGLEAPETSRHQLPPDPRLRNL